jgi:hypothetical protein
MTDNPCKAERDISYHEAGHAVVGMELFSKPEERIETATIVPTEEYCGVVIFDIPSVNDWQAEYGFQNAEERAKAINEGILAPDEAYIGSPEEWGAEWASCVDNRIIMGFAGGIAESVSRDEKPDYVNLRLGDCSSDFGIALSLGLLRAPNDKPYEWSNGDSETGLYLAWLFHRAELLVRSPDRWIRIEALANALLERKTLSGEEAGRVAGAALNALSDEKRAAAWVGNNKLLSEAENQRLKKRLDAVRTDR